jgi:HD-GYP domain-containing protein (c-di-GMP phosphodiesterase class II)
VSIRDVGRITCSAGVCDLERATDADEIYRFADGALYWAKEHGRDQVCAYLPDVVTELSAKERAERLARVQKRSALLALARAIDARDPATQRHSERVAEVAVLLAEAMGWSAQATLRLREAALLHDVGKIGIPDAVLFKPGALLGDEYDVVKHHADLGARITGDVLDVGQAGWVRHHHERWDGTGYPDGLANDAIPEVLNCSPLPTLGT